MKMLERNGEYDVAYVDFDGTLLDTFPLWWEAHMLACRSFGVSAPEQDYTLQQWKRNFNGTKMRDIAKVLIERYRLAADVEAFIEKRNDCWIRLLLSDHPVLGTTNFSKAVNKELVLYLSSLKKSGCKVYIVSRNFGSIIAPTLEHLGLSELFYGYVTNCKLDRFRCETDMNEEKEETFTRLMLHHGTMPSRCIVFDDSDSHVAKAQELGMDAVKITL